MRVLVTGGTGYLGRAIVRALMTRGHEPVVFARGASTAGLPARAIDGDVRDRAALAAAVRGCDALCHAAALVRLWRPDAREFHDVNVTGLRNALEAARDGRPVARRLHVVVSRAATGRASGTTARESVSAHEGRC